MTAKSMFREKRFVQVPLEVWLCELIRRHDPDAVKILDTRLNHHAVCGKEV